MESDGKGHLRQQENCILRGEKGKFCGTNWTTHHFDAAANWIEGEISSILSESEIFSEQDNSDRIDIMQVSAPL